MQPPGAPADPIVVDGVPVKDIAVLGGEGQGIVLVMKGGKVFKDAL